MNSKERVLSAIKFKGIDRLPRMFRSLGFVAKELMKYFKIGDEKDQFLFERNYKKLVNALGIDYWSSGCSIGKFSTFVPAYKGPALEFEDNNYYSAVGIPTAPKTIEKYDYTFTEIISNPLANAESPEEIEGFLTSKLDYFDYKNLVNNIDRLHSAGIFGSDNDKQEPDDIMENFSIERLSSEKDNFICMGNSLNNSFMLCCYLRGMDKFLFDLAGNIKMAEAVVKEVGTFVLEYNKRYLGSPGIVGEYFATWDDVAMQGGMMFAPSDFKKFFLPIWKDLISMVKSKNMIFSWHCCGNVNDVLPLMIDAGIDVFDVLQTSARNMKLDKFYSKFGRSVCVHGGIDVQKLLFSGTEKEIRQEVKKIKELWGTRGGIIAGPSHEIVPGTPIENILVLYNELSG